MTDVSSLHVPYIHYLSCDKILVLGAMVLKGVCVCVQYIVFSELKAVIATQRLEECRFTSPLGAFMA